MRTLLGTFQPSSFYVYRGVIPVRTLWQGIVPPDFHHPFNTGYCCSFMHYRVLGRGLGRPKTAVECTTVARAGIQDEIITVVPPIPATVYDSPSPIG